MFEVFKFECGYQLRSPLFVVLAVTFFLFAFFLMASEGVSLGGVGNNLNYNAAWTIVFTQFFFSIIGMFAVIAIVSQAITRDYELKTAEILFCTGISERQFLLGRYFGAGLFGLLVAVAALLGTMMGTFMPWLDQERVGEFVFAPYLYAFAVVSLPNLFFSSALFYAIAALTRSMLAAFVGAVGFVVLYVVIANVVDPEKIELLAMFGPFGQVAFGEVSRYWTVFERNTQLVPVAGDYLVNRVLWSSIGVIALAATAWRFRFTLNPSAFRRVKKPGLTRVDLPQVTNQLILPRFGPMTFWRQLRSQIRIDLAAIYKSIPFYAILGFALLNVWGAFSLSSQGFGVPLLPTTGGLVRAMAGSFTFFIVPILIFYAGELVHRERQAGISDVIDATPFANGVMIASKIASLWFIVTSILVIGMVAALISQLLQGYHRFEFGLYLQGLFFVQGGYFFLLAVLAVFVQVLSANKWIGMLVFLSLFIFIVALPNWDFQHALYLFRTPSAPHSDMNGYGHYLQPLVAMTAYWSVFCALLAVIAHLLYARGRVESLGMRLQIAKTRLSPAIGASAVTLLLGFASLGGWIFYNTNVLNPYLTGDEVEAQQASYEREYKRYQGQVSPQPLAIENNIDLFPEQRRLESNGVAEVVNASAEPMDELLVSTHPFADVNQLTLAGAELVSQNTLVGAHVFRFDPPLLPGAETQLGWDITWHHRGFANSNIRAISAGAYDRVVENGTFVNNSEVMPIFGYNPGAEISDPTTRREYGLEPIERLPQLNDPDWVDISQFGVSQRADFRTTFTTSADQIAIAPGYQVGEMVEVEGRRTYVYEMDKKIWPFVSFLSARYDVRRDHHAGVDIEIYHHPEHAENVPSMISGTKKSLDYFNAAFSPYQYRQFRIMEFPRYASFAQSFPNTIPFSESIGFVADLRDEHAIDLVFYVTAHEMAHQWWAHQVVGAYMQGMTVIVETLAQYSALMVMEAEYGADKMRRFLRYELDLYLSNRGGELVEELPLVRVENQPYIHYRKGSLVMYALQDAIGEDNVNLALRNFLAKFGDRGAPFPSASQLVEEFRAVANDEHQALIADLFENITLYDLSVDTVTAVPKGEQWEVSLSIEAHKFYADGLGEETSAPLNAWLDVAVFPHAEEELEDYQLPKPLVMERVLIESGTREFTFLVDQKPHRVGIDPYNKMIDRNPEDNLKYISGP